MKAKVLFFLSGLSLFFAAALFAAESVRISGIDIPLVEGARPLHIASSGATQARIVSYVTEVPLEEVAGFYERFFKINGFVIIGGMQEGAYSASLKKNAVMFALSIYPQGNKTVIRFVW